MVYYSFFSVPGSRPGDDLFFIKAFNFSKNLLFFFFNISVKYCKKNVCEGKETDLEITFKKYIGTALHEQQAMITLQEMAVFNSSYGS